MQVLKKLKYISPVLIGIAIVNLIGCSFCSSASAESNSVSKNTSEAQRAELKEKYNTNLLPLMVKGNQLITSDGKPFRFKGVNCAGLEWSSNGEGHIVETCRVAIEDWKVNVIRLPLSQDRWFGKTPEQTDEGKEYQEIVDTIINMCAEKDVYCILDLHWNDKNEWGKNIGQHSMPDLNSKIFWEDIAPKYANHPAVIYDLYNEPHDVTWDKWLNGGLIMDKPNTRQGGQASEYECIGMQPLLDAVRATAAKNLVVIGGLDWSYDFSGILDGRQLKDSNGNGIIYTNHCYDNKNQAVDTWIANMETASKVFPIIIGEFGGSYIDFANQNTGGRGSRRGSFGGFGGFGGFGRGGVNGPDWLMRIMQAIEDHQWSYTAWDLHPSAGPTLVSDWNYTPTQNFGIWVKQMLDGTWKKYTSAPAEESTQSNQ